MEADSHYLDAKSERTLEFNSVPSIAVSKISKPKGEKKGLQGNSFSA